MGRCLLPHCWWRQARGRFRATRQREQGEQGARAAEAVRWRWRRQHGRRPPRGRGAASTAGRRVCRGRKAKRPRQGPTRRHRAARHGWRWWRGRRLGGGPRPPPGRNGRGWRHDPHRSRCAARGANGGGRRLKRWQRQAVEGVAVVAVGPRTVGVGSPSAVAVAGNCSLAHRWRQVGLTTLPRAQRHDAHSARTVPGVLHFCPALWCQCLRELWHSVPSPSQCQVHGRHSRSQASQCLDHRRHSSAQCPGYTRHSSVSEVSAEGIESVKMNCRCIHDTYTST